MTESVTGLYLSREMGQYRAAYYQKEFMDALADKVDLEFYGPGFPGFDETKPIDRVLRESRVAFDFIILGHSWLTEFAEGPTTLVDLKLESVSLPIFAILNKEYNQLERKLRYLETINCALLFSHHGDALEFGNRIGAEGYFVPFGYPEKLINRAGACRPTDLFFSGLLKNKVGEDTRLSVMRSIFYCLGDLPVAKRKEFRDLQIFWNGIPRQTTSLSSFRYRLSRLGFPQYAYHHLSRANYFSKLGEAKLVLASISPGGLIGPRVFEAMASGAVVFCEETDLYDKVLPNNLLITFQSDMSDFETKLKSALANKERLTERSEQGRTLALKEFSWSSRAEEMAKRIVDWLRREI